MSVRRAQERDLDALMRLGQRYCAADRAPWVPERARAGFLGLLRDDDNGVVLVCEVAGDVIGYAVLNGKTQQLEDDINEASVQVLNLVVANRQKVNLTGT